jgi:LysM repeat protein
MSYQDKIRAAKRDQFRQKQQRNRIAGQLNQDYAALKNANPNLTAAQIFAQQGTAYTVTDNDTIESIAEKNGVDPTNILDANPELKNLQTGMVIKTPRQDRFDTMNAGGFGLPSNAALGGLTNNPQGNNPFSSVTGSSGFSNPFAQREAQTYNALNANTNASQNNWSAPRPQGSVYLPPGLSPAQREAAMRSMGTQTASPTTPSITPPTNATTPTVNPGWAQYQYMSRNLFHQQIRTKVDNAGYIPTPGELGILETMGFIKRDNSSTGGGFSWTKGRKKGGGGGGRTGGGGGGGVPREPAFSNGAGSFGLINWRI